MTTRQRTSESAERLRALADQIIIENDEGRFNMDEWLCADGGFDEPTPVCETVHCIAGTALLMQYPEATEITYVPHRGITLSDADGEPLWTQHVAGGFGPSAAAWLGFYDIIESALFVAFDLTVEQLASVLRLMADGDHYVDARSEIVGADDV